MSTATNTPIKVKPGCNWSHVLLGVPMFLKRIVLQVDCSLFTKYSYNKRRFLWKLVILFLPFLADVAKPEGEVFGNGVHSLVYRHQTFNATIRGITYCKQFKKQRHFFKIFSLENQEGHVSDELLQSPLVTSLKDILIPLFQIYLFQWQFQSSIRWCYCSQV